MLVHALGVTIRSTGVNMRGMPGPRSKGQSFSIGSWEDSSISVQEKGYLYLTVTEGTLYYERE